MRNNNNDKPNGTQVNRHTNKEKLQQNIRIRKVGRKTAGVLRDLLARDLALDSDKVPYNHKRWNKETTKSDEFAIHVWRRIKRYVKGEFTILEGKI